MGATKNISFAGGDGSSIETAVVIQGASSSVSGVRAEGAWLTAKFPGYQKKRQALIDHLGKKYDSIEIETSDGKRLSIIFDISDFFGIGSRRI